MKHRAVTVIAAVIISPLCVGASSPDIAAVRVAVFEVLFGEQTDLKNLVLFLSVGERPQDTNGVARDPDAEVLRQLRDRGWETEPGSRAAPFDKVAGVRDATSGKRGIWFYVGHVEWTSPSEVAVYGEFWANGKSSEVARYRLSREKDAWKLISRSSIRKS